MVEFETVKANEKKFGTNNFIEVARKKAKSDEGENEFIAISRGFFAKNDESKRYTKSIAIPVDGEMVDFIKDSLTDAMA
jgi:hypothetical protein